MKMTGRPNSGMRGSAGRTGPWFVVSNATRFEFRGGRMDEVPAGLRHAKRTGTVTAACGLSSLSWTKFFDLPFSPRERAACPACALAVRRPET